MPQIISLTLLVDHAGIFLALVVTLPICDIHCSLASIYCGLNNPQPYYIYFFGGGDFTFLLFPFSFLFINPLSFESFEIKCDRIGHSHPTNIEFDSSVGTVSNRFNSTCI